MGVGSSALRAAVLAVLLAGCAEAEAPLPAAPARVDLGLEEFRFIHAPEVAAGRVVVEFHNTGGLAHEMALVVLPEDFPPIDEQLRGESRQATRPLIDITRPAGSTGTFAVDLAPGRYAFICFQQDVDGVRHYLKGMSSEIRAR